MKKKIVVGNKLKVTVINGRDLKCKDSSKDVCPYCVLQSGVTSLQTKHINHNSNPQWNEDFILDADPGCEVLSFSIWHKNTFRSDVVIGYAFVDFGSCKQDEKTTINIQLQGVYSGEIKLSVLPLYETTASRVERLEHEIELLKYELTNHRSKNELLTKHNSELSLANEDLIKTNTLLEHDNNMLQEYDILSTPARSRGTYSSSGYDISSCGSPRSRRCLSSSVFDRGTNEKQLNGIAEMKDLNGTNEKHQSFDEFDIITEKDIDCILHKSRTSSKMTSEKVVNDVTKNDEANRFSFTFTSECEHDESEGVEQLDEADRIHKQQKHEEDSSHNNEEANTNTISVNNTNALTSRVSSLEGENTELKLFIQQLQFETGDELSQLIDELDTEVECEFCDTMIKSKISRIRQLKYENNTKISLLRELISSLNSSIDQMQTSSDSQDCQQNYEEDFNIDLDRTDEIEQNEQYENEDDELLSPKSPNEPDVIKEYYWDEYLPISHPNNDSESTTKIYNDVTNLVDGITDDIDDFIKNNYLFHNGNTVILRSDPELYARSEVEEENEHFKDMNIRLIKENEELDGCLQLVQVQVQNLKKIQSILFDQLVKRAPSCMTNIMDNFGDYSQILNEDQVTLYKSHLGSVLDEIVTVAGGGGEMMFKDTTPRSDNYKFAVSLMHH